MVAVSNFSGLVSSACALARAPAMVPIDSLDRCMGCLHAQDIEAHGSGFRPLGPNPMPDGLLGVFRHQALELGLVALVFKKRRAVPPKHPGKFGPGIGRAHVNDANGSDPRPRRLGAQQPRRLGALAAAPELFLGGPKPVAVAA